MIDAIHPCPEALTATHWEKRKGSLPAGSELPARLKSLFRKHEAVDWKSLAAGWSRSCETPAALEQAFAERERSYRGQVLPLKREATEVTAAAQQLAKDKSAAKASLEAARSILEAAKRYAEAIDVGGLDLRKEFDRAHSGLAARAPGNGGAGAAGGDDDDAGSALLDPRRLLMQLTLCKRDPERRVQFGCVDGHDKQPGVLALHPKIGARKLMTTLQAETGVKTGACGTAWVEGTELMLQPEKPLAGLVKKLRDPVKASGFRVTRIVLWNADGTVFEQAAALDDDAAAAAPGAQTPATDPLHAFTTRLKAFLPLLAAAGNTPQAQAAKRLAGEAGVQARNGDFAAAQERLGEAEHLLGAAAATTGDTSVRTYAPLMPLWDTASEAAVEQASALVVELRKLDEPELDRMADDLLAAIERLLAPVAELVEDFDAFEDPERPEYAPDALRQVEAIRVDLDRNRLIAAADENPLGVPLHIGRTLRTALDDIAAVLQA
ncbi:MAG: hypothetical protein JNN18_23495 [Rubrivivax sp.]|nr:hypothetical protein [Rubrivivax sp.]